MRQHWSHHICGTQSLKSPSSIKVSERLPLQALRVSSIQLQDFPLTWIMGVCGRPRCFCVTNEGVRNHRLLT